MGKKYEASLKAKLNEAAETNKPDAKPETSVTWLKIVSNVFAIRA